MLKCVTFSIKINRTKKKADLADKLNKASRLVFLSFPSSLSPALLRYPELIALQTQPWVGVSTRAQRKGFLHAMLEARCVSNFRGGWDDEGGEGDGELGAH